MFDIFIISIKNYYYEGSSSWRTIDDSRRSRKNICGSSLEADERKKSIRASMSLIYLRKIEDSKPSEN